MTFLPIVERELRVAARQRNTFWIRLAAALIGAVILTGGLVLTQIQWFRPSVTNVGRGLFSVLSWLTFAGALTIGLFFTSDCLSREKREGTLGFLFLTDLRGYDVVLGKFLTHSLRSIYGLLALLPILATTLLMGGVTPGEFWMTVVALLNALLVSLAAGVFVSSISRDSQKAQTGTLLLLSLLVGGGPIADVALGLIKGQQLEVLSNSSAGFLFHLAGGSPGAFGISLLINQVIFCALLGMSCLILPKTWQEKGEATVGTFAAADAGKRRSGDRRKELRSKLLSVNPVLWLLCRERVHLVSIWAPTLLMFLGTVILMVAGILQAQFFWSSIAGLLVLTIYLGVASMAGRFFVEGRRGGLLELLLATPLTVSSIIAGQRRAFTRWLAVPLALWIGSQLIAGFMAQRAQGSFLGARTPSAPATGATNVSTTNVTVTTGRGVPAGFVGPTPAILATIQVSGAITFLANVWALTWFGMWMGMSSPSANIATLRTIAFVQVIPWFGITFVSTIAAPLLLWKISMTSGFSYSRQILLTTAVTTGLYLLKDILLALIARRRLYADFRQLALGVATSRAVPLSPRVLPVAVPSQPRSG